MELIILGMDNTGKTTLANQLSEQLKIDIIHSKGPNQTKWDMENFINFNLNNGDAIFERFCFFEEMVYGSIIRGHSEFTFRDPIFKTIINCKPTIIYCRPNKKIIKNWQQREQMEGVIDKADELLKKFDKVIKKAQKYGLRVIKYDYTQETVFDVIAKL